MTAPTADTSLYRPAAGIVVFNNEGQAWYGCRKGEKSRYKWQFPQGGIDKGESPKEAALRELWEETGLRPKHVEVIGRIKDWLYYDFPPEYVGGKVGKGWVGQKQKWFAVRLKKNSAKFDLKAHLPIEFSKWRWADLEEAPLLIVPFKRDVYERVVFEFGDYAKPKKNLRPRS